MIGSDMCKKDKKNQRGRWFPIISDWGFGIQR